MQSFLNWGFLRHYLDDFIRVFSKIKASAQYLRHKSINYCHLIVVLGVPQATLKVKARTVVVIFGSEINTNIYGVRLPEEKLAKTLVATTKVLSANTITLLDMQLVTGFISFCAQAVQLDWVFMRRFWNFLAAFLQNEKKN